MATKKLVKKTENPIDRKNPSEKLKNPIGNIRKNPSEKPGENPGKTRGKSEEEKYQN